MAKGKEQKTKEQKAAQTARTNANKRKAWKKHLERHPSDSQNKKILGGK